MKNTNTSITEVSGYVKRRNWATRKEGKKGRQGRDLMHSSQLWEKFLTPIQKIIIMNYDQLNAFGPDKCN